MRLTDEQIQAELVRTTGWVLQNQAISRTFQFVDFKSAMAFVNRVAELAEQLDHHPDILITYNTVRLSIFTHSEGGLTDKDFQLAREVNNIK